MQPSGRIRRGVSWTVGAGAVAAAALFAGQAGALADQPAGTSICASSQLEATAVSTEAGAGHRYGQVKLRNTSDNSCTLNGYVGLQLRDSNGRPLPTRVEHKQGTTPRPVELEPFETVAAELEWGVVPTGDEQGGQCQSAPASVDVGIPGHSRPQTVGSKWDLGPVCDQGTITVSPLAVS
ncbi:hypothetical protein GCM10010191_11120 [Actinomadura vinacea]|uniref:DUF4232 domain-containing protein n=1 Tax=Actinomadura vinacea TaxID=115336 RepID=A0ABP5VJS3_9ACTN